MHNVFVLARHEIWAFSESWELKREVKLHPSLISPSNAKQYIGVKHAATRNSGDVFSGVMNRTSSYFIVLLHLAIQPGFGLDLAIARRTPSVEFGGGE